MARILIVGIATLDIVNEVERYPVEDDEVRVRRQHRRCGGNAANTAMVLRQFGHDCDFLGSFADDDGARFIRAEMAAAGIDLRHAPVIAGAATPTSYITLSRATGSRTIVHHRDLPELRCQQCSELDFGAYDWIHFEGRNVDVSLSLLRAIDGRVPISVEIEKPRPDIENLFPLANLLLFSRQYARAVCCEDPHDFLATQATTLPDRQLVCAWGERGAAALRDGNYHWADAPRLAKVVDSVGAGDTFNAGIIAALLAGLELPLALRDAVALAARKCGQHGLGRLVPGPETSP
ncbi:MAG: ketohexokinase [Gammaproteobacteria bacterium]|nr:ketohexokinase [Gammaproteobacteria bacterium]